MEAFTVAFYVSYIILMFCMAYLAVGLRRG
jgi:hypothetical protein